MPNSAERHSRPAGKPFDAIVIGGGIAGCALARELASRGVKVVILEQNAIAAESSGRNTGTLLSGPQKEVVELLDASVAIYGELAEGPVPFEFARIGHLLISEDEASFENRLPQSLSATDRRAWGWRGHPARSSPRTIRG